MQRLMIIGNLGRDPEIRYTQSGKPIATLNVGASERKTDKDGNHVTETEWFRVVAFGNTADACQRFLHKGSQIYVDGKLKTRTYTKDGREARITEVLADTIQFLDRKEKSSQGSSQRQERGSESIDDMDNLPF